MKFIYVASVVNTLNVSEYTTQNNLTWKNLIVMGSQLSLLKELWDVLPDENGNQTELNTQLTKPRAYWSCDKSSYKAT